MCIFWKFCKRNYANIINTIMAIIAIAGLLFLVYELKGIREQNRITERSFRQSYKPFGYVEYTEPDVNKRFKFPTDDRGKFNISTKIDFINKGKGILFAIGFIRFNEFRLINFNAMNFIQYINENDVELDSLYNFDKIPSMERLKPFIPEQSREFTLEWENMDKITYYYLYSIHLYKDQEQNLYETVNLTFLRFLKSIKKKRGIMPFDRFWHNQYFHEYSKEDQNKLADYIEELGHPMADFIR